MPNAAPGADFHLFSPSATAYPRPQAPLPPVAKADPDRFFDRYWRKVCAKVRRPLSGLLLPEEAVAGLATRVFEAFYTEFDAMPARAEGAKFLLGRALREALEHTAAERERSGDRDRFHNPEEQLYDHNLDLLALQQHSAEGRLNSPEWNHLPAVLRGRAWSVLRRCGVPEDECEDLFIDTLAALAQVREKDDRAPIEQLTVFEEVVPLFTTMVHNRGVSWLRKRSARKNRPNNPEFAESLDDPDRHKVAASTADATAGPWDGLSFDRIYEGCRDCLSELEWHVLTVLFVEANATRGDLADDPWVMEQMGVSPASSMGNRRRHLNRHLQSALDKLGNCLKTRDL